MLITSKIKPKFKKRFYDTSNCNLVMFLQKSNKKTGTSVSFYQK